MQKRTKRYIKITCQKRPLNWFCLEKRLEFFCFLLSGRVISCVAAIYDDALLTLTESLFRFFSFFLVLLLPCHVWLTASLIDPIKMLLSSSSIMLPRLSVKAFACLSCL